MGKDLAVGLPCKVWSRCYKSKQNVRKFLCEYPVSNHLTFDRLELRENLFVVLKPLFFTHLSLHCSLN